MNIKQLYLDYNLKTSSFEEGGTDVGNQGKSKPAAVDNLSSAVDRLIAAVDSPNSTIDRLSARGVLESYNFIVCRQGRISCR